MEKTQYIADVAADMPVASLFMVKRADLRSKRGERFVHMTLADKSGTMECKAYGPDELVAAAARAVRPGMVYAVIGKGRQMQNGEMEVVSEGKATLDSLLSGPMPLTAGQDTEFVFTPADVAGNARELQKVVAGIVNGDLRLFVACCLDSRFYGCPAAIRRHHEYTGGLCEHALETVRFALSMVDTMERMEVNRDMVIAGAVLHDIGKIFCFDKVGYGYVPNDTYNLIEHITMGIMFVDEYKNLISDSQLLQLRHIIQSHHGSYGDVIPLTAEAWVVHYADTVSSQMRSVADDVAETPKGQKKKGLRSEKFLWKAV